MQKPSARQRRRADDEPSLVIAPPPPLPPSGDELMGAFEPATRKEQILWGLRFYGFIGGLIVVSLTILFLLVTEVLMPEPPVEELTEQDLARMEAERMQNGNVSAPVLDLEPGYLAVVTEPEGAAVQIDGLPWATSPTTERELEPGYYLISVLHEDYAPRDTLIHVAEGGTTRIELALTTDLARPLPAPRVRESARSSAPARTQQQTTRRSNAPASEAAGRERDSAPVTATTPTTASVRQPQPRTGALAVVSEPAEARVLLDGNPAGTTPLLLTDIPTGEHEILVHSPGYAAASRIVNVEAGSQETLRLSLEGLHGTISVLARPWGSIYVDGKLAKRDTDVLFTTAIGTGFHTIRVVHPVLGEQERTVEVRPGLTTRVVFELENN